MSITKFVWSHNPISTDAGTVDAVQCGIAFEM